MADVREHSQGRQKTAPDAPDPRERRCAIRRRVLIAVLVVVFIAVAVAINLGPITHYVDARERLETVSSEVEELEARSAQMHRELSRALEPGYLEVLARQELTYARSDEELFIITTDEDPGAAIEAPAPLDEPSLESDDDGPGFLERMLNRISDLF